MDARKTLILLALASALTAIGGTVPISNAPVPEYTDLECVTNAPIRASMLQRARVFEGSISLLATPSNTVEVAFGTARNNAGVLLLGDESFSIGWEGGSWFLSSQTNRVCSAPQEGAATRTLSFTLRVFETGEPHALSLSATGAGDAFAALVATPPAWMFSRSWDTVRLTIRGVDNPDENVSVQFNTDPGVIIMR